MKKGKMFKKSISCLLAALMIIASMPFSAISASAADNSTIGLSVDSSGNKMYGVLTNNSGTGDNRFKTVSGSTTKYAILCNDAQNDNFDIAYMNFNVKPLIDSGVNVATADLTVNISVESYTEDCGLRICYPTDKNSEFYQYGQKKLLSHTVWSKNDGDHISRANSYYGLTDIISYDTVAEVTGDLTVDIADAIKWAINNNKETATVCFLLKKAGQTAGAGPDSTHVWTDTNLNFTNDTVKINTILQLDNFERKTANNYGTFENDSDDNTVENYRKAYKNCLYAPSRMTSSYTFGQFDMSSDDKYYSKADFYYGNTVMLYDGITDPQIGVGFGVWGYSKPGTWGWDGMKVFKCNLYNTPDLQLVNNRWRGKDGRMNYTYIMYNSNNSDTIGTTSNSECRQGQKGYYGNYLKYSGGDFTNGYKTIRLNFTFTTGHDKGGAVDHTTGEISNATVFVVNYNKVIQKVNEARTKYNNLDKANCDVVSLNNFARAINTLQKFDPNSYDYANGPGLAAQKAGNDINSLVQAVDDAYKNIKYNYTFKSAAEPAVETVVAAKNASDAYANKPANTVTNSKPLNEKQHTTYTYSWPTNPSGFVFTENKTEVTENHDFRTSDTCACGAKVDVASFEAAAKEASTIYLTSGTTYEGNSKDDYYNVSNQAVNKRKNGDFLCQDDFDKATYEILYAKTKLRNNTGTVTLTVYDQNNQEITGAGNSYTKNYGEEITIQPATEQNVYKYVIEKDGATSEIYGQQSISYVVTGDATVKAYCNKTQSADEKYTKVTFVVGGKISDIKYVKANETLDTSTANKLQFPFFTTGDWNTASVQGSADVSSVTVNAALTPVDSDTCGVYIPGNDGNYTAYQKKYDEKVDVKDYGLGDTSDYALSKSPSKDDIIAYMHGTVFYVPARSKVYVIPVDKGESTKETKVNTVGTFTSVDDKNKYVGFNCKFSLAEGCTPIEWGITFIPMNADYRPVDENGNPTSSTVFRIKTHSKENEYAATLSLSKNSTKYSAIRAKAYLKYKDADNNLQVTYGDEYVQAFGTSNKFGITQ
ncbi:hypothetical protein [uncultured Eubacterium sp.]|uniref:hypothetical protein n=1 Tax=uncultured Eubacterium sp. TaxID=165185 RepID=UPI0025F581FB|nr:hypothetical protein [uncultured Eubacterium sp.]